MNKKVFRPFISCFFFLCFFLLVQTNIAAAALTWDGQTISLPEISHKLNSPMVDAAGNYQPLYFEAARQLWQDGLLLGADGSFNLDQPITRAEGIIMILRLLGKESKVKTADLACSFTDVPDWAKSYAAYAQQNGIANGYSATVFGASDPMTANQYLTFILRAMGYNDQAGDFSWDTAADTALAIGLIDLVSHHQYTHSNLFLRDHAVIISYQALYQIPSKNGKLLSADLVLAAPTGDLPYATMAAKFLAEGNAVSAKALTPAAASLNYNPFSIPTYETIAPFAQKYVLKATEQLLFLVYSTSLENTILAESTILYETLLKKNGFAYQGEIKMESDHLADITGGIALANGGAWNCEWYGKEDLQIVFGPIDNCFLVRIYQKKIDVFSPDQLREWEKIIKFHP